MSIEPPATVKPPLQQPEKAAESTPASQAKPETPAQTPELPNKTRGEKFYDVFQFIFGKVFIVAITAVLAFAADQKYGPKTILGVPNVLKQFQGWFAKKVMHNKVYPVAEKGEFAKLVGGGLIGTMILSHGGNMFAPFIKWLENDREQISNWYNKKFGAEQDVKDAHERLKDIPQQSWGDVAKGRVVAWATVFATMVGAYTVVGKDKKTGKYWLDVYEDKFARVFSGISKSGKEIAATPVAKELTEIQKANKTYRFGKVLALDLYATTAAIIIWNTFSRMSAKKRTLKEQLEANQKIPTEYDLRPDAKTALEGNVPQIQHPPEPEPEKTAILNIEPKKKIESKIAAGYSNMAKKAKEELAELHR